MQQNKLMCCDVKTGAHVFQEKFQFSWLVQLIVSKGQDVFSCFRRNNLEFEQLRFINTSKYFFLLYATLAVVSRETSTLWNGQL